MRMEPRSRTEERLKVVKKMDRVLVTGGAGYIGSHACKALAEAGYLPVSYDSLCRGNEWAVRWGPLERGDVRDVIRAPAHPYTQGLLASTAHGAAKGQRLDTIPGSPPMGGSPSRLPAIPAATAGRVAR